jgi:hypothetical protein
LFSKLYEFARQLLVQVLLTMPWPFSDRDAVVHIHGVDCMDVPASDTADAAAAETAPRQVVVLMRSVEETAGGDDASGGTPATDVPPTAAGITRVRVHEAAILLTPLACNGGGTGTQVDIFCHVDPKLAFVHSGA